MTERFTETVATGIVTDTLTGKEYNCEMRIDDDFLNLVNTIAEENEQLKKQISYLIRELKTEMETSISRNERIRLDFAITVLESLKR